MENLRGTFDWVLWILPTSKLLHVFAKSEPTNTLLHSTPFANPAMLKKQWNLRRDYSLLSSKWFPSLTDYRITGKINYFRNIVELQEDKWPIQESLSVEKKNMIFWASTMLNIKPDKNSDPRSAVSKAVRLISVHKVSISDLAWKKIYYMRLEKDHRLL
jgi:hypothetical protein